MELQMSDLVPTKKRTRVGRTVYKTKKGESVSELGVSIPIDKEKTHWLNAPSIYKGKKYTDDQVWDMFLAGKIKPSEYEIIKGTKKDATAASIKRSAGLLKKKKKGGYLGVGQALRGYGAVRKG